MYKQVRILPPEEDEQPPLPAAAASAIAEPHPPEPLIVRPAPSATVLAVAAIALVALCSVVAFVVVSSLGVREVRSPTALPQPAALLVQPTEPVATALPAIPTPSCTGTTTYLEIIARQEQANHWEDAVATAEAALSDTHLCPADSKLLTARAVADGLKVLYNKPFAPLDVAAQQQEIDRYLSLRERAHDAQVAFDSPLQVAGQAYQIGQFPLARVAVEQALAAGDYRPELDRATTRMYISTLYNLGSWYSQAPAGSEVYQEGLAWLAASHQLALHYQTGQAEAAMLLRQLVGQEEASWPTPAPTPLLHSK